jgi:hypothetical protein
LRADALTMLRDGLNTQLEPSATPAVRSKRAGAALHAYGEAIGATTMQDRLARTDVLGEMRRTGDAAAIGGLATPESPLALTSF